MCELLYIVLFCRHERSSQRKRRLTRDHEIVHERGGGHITALMCSAISIHQWRFLPSI